MTGSPRADYRIVAADLSYVVCWSAVYQGRQITAFMFGKLPYARATSYHPGHRPA
jgi:hypothetical protein